ATPAAIAGHICSAAGIHGPSITLGASGVATSVALSVAEDLAASTGVRRVIVLAGDEMTDSISAAVRSNFGAVQGGMTAAMLSFENCPTQDRRWELVRAGTTRVAYDLSDPWTQSSAEQVAAVSRLLSDASIEARLITDIVIATPQISRAAVAGKFGADVVRMVHPVDGHPCNIGDAGLLALRAALVDSAVTRDERLWLVLEAGPLGAFGYAVYRLNPRVEPNAKLTAADNT
ncbi:MAG: hypothetical protein M3Q30_03625, partial [Actinomycetota bacterium]|nr:hypothetical protein [Actinomycetota bacterium]